MKYYLLMAALIMCGCSCNPDRNQDADSTLHKKEVVAPLDEAAIFEDESEPETAPDAQVEEPKDDAKSEKEDDGEKADDKQKSTHTDVAIKSEKNGVRIDVHYPELGNSEFDSVIQKKAESTAKNAQNRLANLRRDDPDDMYIYEYDLSYDVVRSHSDSADVMFTHNEYTGGAHGSVKLEAMMLDANGKQIDPWSLFDNVDDALPKISAEARRQLTEKYADIEGIQDMIKAGTEPTRENFKNMVRTDDGVRIYFEPYTVAPGSEGVLYIDYKMQ